MYMISYDEVHNTNVNDLRRWVFTYRNEFLFNNARCNIQGKGVGTNFSFHFHFMKMKNWLSMDGAFTAYPGLVH